jgi:hypothetical protein
MAEQYMLKKWIWTDADFDSMTWHDCTIHAFASPENYDLAIDIDYICQCVLSPDKTRYSFWIAPATLVFENVTDIDFQFFNFIALGINVIERVKAQPKADSELGYGRCHVTWGALNFERQVSNSTFELNPNFAIMIDSSRTNEAATLLQKDEM